MSEIIRTHLIIEVSAVGFDGSGGDAELVANFAAGVVWTRGTVSGQLKPPAGSQCHPGLLDSGRLPLV